MQDLQTILISFDASSNYFGRLYWTANVEKFYLWTQTIARKRSRDPYLTQKATPENL